MPIDPQSIDKFLTAIPRYVPEFKGMPPEQIYREIYDVTGKPYREAKVKLRKHQLEGLAYALWTRRSIMFYDMRLGKTSMSLEWARHLREAGFFKKKGMVIAHSPIGLGVWEEQIARHSTLTARLVRSSSEEFAEALESDCDLVVVPWSGLQAIFSAKAQVRAKKSDKLISKMVPDLDLINIAAEAFDLCIIDEIHMCKNHSSLRFKIASVLVKHCKWRMGLTGTPIGRDPFAVWAQTFLIDDGKTLGFNYYFFEQAFGRKQKNWYSPRKTWLPKRDGRMEWVGFEWVFDEEKMPVLNQKLAGISLSYFRHEVAVDDVRPAIIEIQMTTAQREAYDNAVNKVIQLHDHPDPQEMKNAFVRLRQIASGFLPYINKHGEETIVEFPNAAKLEWLDTLLEEIGDTPFIIFHEFTYSGRLICDILKKAKIKHGWIYGKTENKIEIARAFQSGVLQCIVANTATGGMSIDLSRADYMVFYESPVDPIIRAQAEARPLAERGNRPLQRDDLVCSPVEHKILGFVKEGKDALREMTKNIKSLLGKLPKR